MCYNLRSLAVSFTYVSYESSGLLIDTVQILVDSQNISTESSGLLIATPNREAGLNFTLPHLVCAES